MWDTLDAEDQREFGFDPRVIDWTHYVREVHLPSVVEHSRVRTTAGRAAQESRETRLRRQVLAPERHVAAFDLENTLIASNVVASYAWLATRRLSPDDRVRFVLRTLAEAPRLLAMDRKDRGDFLRHFYRRYEDAPIDQLDDDSTEMFSDLILTKSFPAAIRRVREHRALGHRTLLITGALDFVVKPAAPAVRRHRVRRRSPPPAMPRRPLRGRAHRRAADRRVARPDPLRLLRGRTTSTRPSRWRTRTRRPTCRCSRRSASRWP